MELQLTKVLIESISLIPSVKLGILDILNQLQSENKCSILFKPTYNITSKDISWCDVLISVRGSDSVSLKIVQEAKKANRYIIYFLDDDLLNLPNFIKSNEYYDEITKFYMSNIIMLCDIIWCVNSLIGEKYGKQFNKEYIVNDVPMKIINFTNYDNDVINFIYAGSIDHTYSINTLISPVVLKICEEFKDRVKFTFIGVNPNIKRDNVCYINYINNYGDYKKFVSQGNFQVGLAPIPNSDFYNYKYINKFLEYTSIGAVGIYSNLPLYSSIIKDNINGFLCENTFESWYSTIKKVIMHNELRVMCLKNAVNMVENQFEMSKVSRDLCEKLPQIINYHAKNVAVEEIRLNTNRFALYSVKLYSMFKKYGVYAVPKLFISVGNRLRR